MTIDPVVGVFVRRVVIVGILGQCFAFTDDSDRYSWEFLKDCHGYEIDVRSESREKREGNK